MSTSVDGLISGLDTTGLINSLMQAERQPQVLLQQKKTALQSVLDIYRSLNTRYDAIATAAGNLNTSSGWLAAAASSTADTVASATTSASSQPGSLSFHVNSLAKAHALVTTTSTSPSTAGTVSGPVSITMGATTTNITDVGDGSINAVAAAINGSGAGVVATVANLGNNQYALQLSAKSTGAASSFTVSGLDSVGTFSVLAQAADASLTVGDPLGVHYDATSATNSFSSLLAGTTITLKTVGDATINVTQDPNALADKVQKLVDAINDARTYVRTNSKYDAASKKAGALLGDSTASNLTGWMTNALINTVGTSGVTAGTVGIGVDRDGTVTFDRAKFLDKYATDPSGVQKLFERNDITDTADDGLAERLRVLAKSATDPATGSITNAIQNKTDFMKSLDASISNWDVRLSQRQARLKAQFSALETALSSLRNQSSWLAGQISKLG